MGAGFSSITRCIGTLRVTKVSEKPAGKDDGDLTTISMMEILDFQSGRATHPTAAPLPPGTWGWRSRHLADRGAQSLADEPFFRVHMHYGCDQLCEHLAFADES